MSEYTKDEIMAMQDDALRRIRAMQRRANQNIHNTQNQPNRQQRNQSNREQPNQPKPPEATQSNSPASVSPAHNVPKQKSANTGDGSLQSIIKGLNLDNDRLTLILLLFVLMREGADDSLIMAICYLIL